MKIPYDLPQPYGMEKKDITELLLREEYGYLPDGKVSVSAHTEDCNTAFCAGKANLNKIILTCQASFGKFSFPIYYTQPTNTEKAVPCFILINFGDEVPHKYLPAEEIVDNGFAVISFCYKDVTSDDGDFTNGLAGVVYPDGRLNPTDCGKIGLWAWAAMRVMDFALTLPELDKEHISIVGHSRLGKTALLTGMLDERFFCAFSNDSGCSGAALSRDKNGETIDDIYKVFPFWFCENYAKYRNSEALLPFDQHFLVSANYPHRVYVGSARGDLWADPENEYLTCVAASRYFEERGKMGFVHPDRYAEVGDVFADGYIGYHLRDGGHYLSREDWKHYIDYVKKNI